MEPKGDPSLPGHGGSCTRCYVTLKRECLQSVNMGAAIITSAQLQCDIYFLANFDFSGCGLQPKRFCENGEGRKVRQGVFPRASGRRFRIGMKDSLPPFMAGVWELACLPCPWISQQGPPENCFICWCFM